MNQKSNVLSLHLKQLKSVVLCTFQLLSKGVVFRAGSQSAAASTQNSLSITVDSILAQKLAPNARIVVWCVTNSGEILADSLDFTVNGAFANEVTVVSIKIKSKDLCLWLLRG